jgi:hypothetical protein
MISKVAKPVLAAMMLAAPLAGFAEGEPAQAPAEASAAPAAAPAGKVKTADTGASMNPWTDCGIGAMIFDETKWAAVTSNVIWDYGITATTSAVSSKHVCEGKKVAAAFFIDTTYASLEEETASGNLTHTVAMLNILGCDNAAQAQIAGEIRSQFGSFVGSDAYATKSQSDKAQAYYFIVDEVTSNQYAQQCQMI